MPQIVISEFMDQESVDQAAADYDVFYDPDLVDRPDELKKLLAEAEALVVRNRTQVTDELLASGPQLKVIGRLGVGLDNIDLDACARRGVEVRPATGANDAAVAEWVLAAAMVLLRGAFLSRTKMDQGLWPRQELMGRETGDKVLGLIGYGAIARQTARRAEALGMKVVGFDPFVPAEDPAWKDVQRAGELDDLLSRSDVVSLHVPLTDGTRHLIDSAALAKMKEGSVLINAARGGVVDEPALAEALRSGRLFGAALDVFENEPLSAEGAGLFAGLSNVILTPHIAGVTVESNQRVGKLTVENVRRVLEGSK